MRATVDIGYVSSDVATVELDTVLPTVASVRRCEQIRD